MIDDNIPITTRQIKKNKGTIRERVGIWSVKGL